jgi:hypothetical protein
MSAGGSLPKPFSAVGTRGTPFISVALVGLIAAAIASLSDIKTVAQLTDLAVFTAYLVVNASLIALAGAKMKRGFTSPRFAGIPLLAYAGALTSLLMLAFFPAHLFALEGAILIAGAILFALSRASGKGARNARRAGADDR